MSGELGGRVRQKMPASASRPTIHKQIKRGLPYPHPPQRKHAINLAICGCNLISIGNTLMKTQSFI